VALPLIFGDRVLGVLAFRFHDVRRFEQAERSIIQSWAAYAAQAIDSADAYAREIAARELAERLQVSLSTTLRSIGDAVITTDATSAITMMNPVAERLTGWSESEAKGRPLTEVFRIVNEHSRAMVVSPVAKVLELGVVVGLANHTVLIARDGTDIPIDDSGAPIRRREDAPIEGVVLVFRDVAQKKSEESRALFLANATTALAESLEHETTLRNVARLAVPILSDWCAVDVLQEGSAHVQRTAVHHVDPVKIALVHELGARRSPTSNAVLDIANALGTGRSEIYSRISDEMLAANGADEEYRRVVRALAPRSAIIVPLLARDRVLGAMTFVFSESDRTYTESDLQLAEELARRCAIAIENARLYASEQRARKSADSANRAKDEFLAVVSHELRTPLNAILGWSRMLTSSSFDESRRARAFETIERNAVAMAQLIDDILDMSRVISGKMRLDVQPIRAEVLVESAIESIRPAADAKGVSLGSTAEPELPRIVGDATRLQQVIWNLLTNAVKFTSHGDRIDVGVRRNGSRVEITVADTGRGIAPQFLRHVFEPFRQEDASYRRSHGGLGLGLAITRQLVELHGGRIEAYSAGAGKGATFTVSLPVGAVSRAEEEPRVTGKRFQSATPLKAPAHMNGLRLLVVDDDPDARQLVKDILEDCGCRVALAGNVEEAMAALAREVPDVLISDVGMPNRDGYDLIKEIRALPPEKGGDVPAAALTAYTRSEDRRRLLNAGYSMHIAKPVEPAELITIVATLSQFLHRRVLRP
jgi:PAS domain S-box-containing protein